MELTRTSVDLYRVGALSFGALLWLQVCASGLSNELSFSEVSWWRVLVFLVPLGLLLAGLLTRNPVATLLLYPLGVATTLGMNPGEAGGGGSDPWSIILPLVTLLAYVFCVSAWLRSPARPSYLLVSSEPVRTRRDRWSPYRLTYWPRAVALFLTFAVTAGAVPILEPIASRVVRSYGVSGGASSGEKGLVLCSLVLFFGWCVLAYVLFISPAMEQNRLIKADRQRVRGSIERSGLRRLKLALVGLLLGAGAVLAALVVLRFS
ncbi:MAG: hypothetical protein JW797_18705 [Bradymonadales bacterium]|nr:hypothetical protein [Bradymonadales bacterium]